MDRIESEAKRSREAGVRGEWAGSRRGERKRESEAIVEKKRGRVLRTQKKGEGKRGGGHKIKLT
jgi:hypothetical protein